MRTRARLLRAVGGGGESPVSGRAGSCREAGILARANRGRTANKRRSSRPKPGNRARARGVTARRTALAYGTQSKVTHNRLRHGPLIAVRARVSRYRLSSAAGVHAQRRATANLPPRVGAARTYAAYRPIRRSGTEDRAWARLRNGRPRVGPLALPRPATSALRTRATDAPGTCRGPALALVVGSHR